MYPRVDGTAHFPSEAVEDVEDPRWFENEGVWAESGIRIKKAFGCCCLCFCLFV